MLEAFSKLGGLLAIFNIAIVLNIIHKYWFYKEVNEYFAESKIVPAKENDEEEGKDAQNQPLIDEIISIEYYKNMIERL